MFISILFSPLIIYLLARICTRLNIKLIRKLTVDKLLGLTVILGLQITSAQFLISELFEDNQSSHKYQRRIETIILLTIVMFCVKYYIQVVISDPGYLAQNKLISYPNRQLKQNNQNKIINITEQCEKHKNTLPFINHGFEDVACIYKYDHDCAWVCNQIGVLNHGIFINFLVVFLIQGVMFLRYLIKTVIYLMQQSEVKTIGHLIVEGTDTVNIILIIVLFISYIFVILISFITLSAQLINSFNGHTVESKHVVKTLVKAVKRNYCKLVPTENDQYQLINIVDYGSEDDLPLHKTIRIIKQQMPYPNGLKQLYHETKYHRYPESLY